MELNTDWYKELAEYLNITQEQCIANFESMDINRQWAERKNDIQFYRDTDFYLYDLTNYACDKGRIGYVNELKKFIKNHELKTGLDYGCGIGTDIIAMYEAGITRVYGVDILSECTAYMNWRLQRRQMPAITFFEIGEDDFAGRFPECDIAVCVAVLEHVQNPAKALRQIVDSCRYLVLRVDPTNPNNAHPMHMEKNFPFLEDVDSGKNELMAEYGLKRNMEILTMPLFEVEK